MDKKRIRSVGRDLNANTAWIYTWDAASNAEYIKIGGSERSSGTRVIREGLLIDLDAIGNVTGIEILSGRPTTTAKRPIAPKHIMYEY